MVTVWLNLLRMYPPRWGKESCGSSGADQHVRLRSSTHNCTLGRGVVQLACCLGHAHIRADRLHLVQPLPRHVQIIAAKVAEGGGLLVDRAA